MVQIKMASHNPSSDLDNLCDNIKSNANLFGFTHIKFNKLKKVDQNMILEAIYVMMDTFKSTPLEISNSLPKSLYD